MKHYKLVFLFKVSILIILFVAILATPAQSSDDWTFMVYLDGDNDLEDEAINDFLEMSSVGSDANVTIAVLFDRRSGYDTSYGDWTDTRQGIINPGDVPDKSWGTNLGELNMGDPQTLINFVEWGMQNYPASKYAVVLWNHGSGWRTLSLKETAAFKDICWDDTDGDRLTTKEVRTALATIESDAQQVDMVGFDACLMAMIEVAYEIREHASVMVGSEEVEPDDGWPYDTALADLVANPSMTAAEFGSTIVLRYYQSYPSDVVTQSAIDLTQVGFLATDVNSFSQIFIDANSTISECQQAAQSVMTSLGSTVISEGHNEALPGSHGLSIYFPGDSEGFDTDYNDSVILFPGDTLWDEFLQEFYTSMPYLSWVSSARSQSQEYWYLEYMDLYDFCEELIICAPDNLSVTPQDDFVSSGDEGGPFMPSYKTYILTNSDANSLQWTTTWSNPWLWIDPNSGSLEPNDSININVCINENAKNLLPGVYTDTVNFWNSSTSVFRMRNAALRVGQTEYFTEQFGFSKNDLDYLTATFVPDGSSNFYRVCVKPATEFPMDPSGGTDIALTDDDSYALPLGGTMVYLYGQSYGDGDVYVGSNGYITFTDSDTAYAEYLGTHFGLPRISTLFYDFNPSSGGNISWKELSDRIGVTYQNVPEYGTSNSNSFQVEMFFDGTIRMTWLNIDINYGLTGLSEGTGIPLDFTESDISAFCLLGDFDVDCDVDFKDYSLFAPYWRQTDCGACGGRDFTSDREVKLDDLMEFAKNWLVGTH